MTFAVRTVAPALKQMFDDVSDRPQVCVNTTCLCGIISTVPVLIISFLTWLRRRTKTHTNKSVIREKKEKNCSICPSGGTNTAVKHMKRGVEYNVPVSTVNFHDDNLTLKPLITNQPARILN